MDLSFSKEDDAFREEVRAFIAEAFTDDLRRKMSLTKNGYLDKEDHILWQKRLHAKGWAATLLQACRWSCRSASGWLLRLS